MGNYVMATEEPKPISNAYAKLQAWQRLPKHEKDRIAYEKLKKKFEGENAVNTEKEVKIVQVEENKTQSPPKMTVEHEVVPQPPVPKSVKHFVHSYDEKCPDCGFDNPLFKDETECSSCGKPLGALETAQNLNGCPYCGGKKLRLKTKK